LGDYEQAYKHFTPFAKDITSASILYRIYSLTLLRLGYAQEVAASFDNIEVLDSSDYAFFQSTAQYLQSVGNKAMARSILERFESVIKEGEDNYSSLNISQLKLNDVKALQNLEALNRDGNADKDAVLALAEYYLSIGDVKAAMQIAEEIQTDFDDNYAAAILKGRAYELSAEYDKARRSFKEVYSIKNDSASALAFFADDAVRNDNLDEAENYAQALYELFPNQSATLQKYLGILKRQEKPTQSINVAKNAYEQNSASGPFGAIYASLLANAGSHAQALDILSSIEQSPSLPPLFWIIKARAELLTDKSEEAENTVDNWLSLNPTFKPAYLFAANIYEITGNISGSIRVLKAAEQFFIEADEIYIMSAFYLIRQGDLDTANRQLNKVSEKSHSLAGYKGVKGELLLLEGKFSQANSLLRDYYNSVKNYQTLNMLTQTLINTSQSDEALALVLAFVKDNPNMVDGIELLAELYIGIDHEQAINAYKRVLLLEPDNHAAMNNSAWLLNFNGKNSEGLKYSQQALQLQPDTPEYLDTHGMILLRLGQVDESLKVLMQSITLKPDSIVIRLHLAEAFKVAGLDRESEQAIRRIDTTNSQWQSEIQRIRSL
jgi:putative PEP-CTERM system TPR-repeat lipoprotein